MQALTVLPAAKLQEKLRDEALGSVKGIVDFETYYKRVYAFEHGLVQCLLMYMQCTVIVIQSKLAEFVFKNLKHLELQEVSNIESKGSKSGTLVCHRTHVGQLGFVIGIARGNYY